MIGTTTIMSFFLVTIPLLFFSIPYTFGSPTRDLCHPDQRDTLLEFKNEFEIRKLPYDVFVEYSMGNVIGVRANSYPKTNSWGNKSDCCMWDGITCDPNSGMVMGLDLSCSCLYGNFKPNSSLFRLQHLQTLNLAYNNFNASLIPAELNRLMRLERLNLSRSLFSGQIPIEILHLTKLVSLDLTSFDMFSSPLFVIDPFLGLLAQNLTNLRELDMSFVNISSKIPQNFSNLTSLRSIRLRVCLLFGILPKNFLLSPTIQFIDLTMNPHLKSSLPEFDGNSSLRYLDLVETSLSGTIPNSIGNLKHLNVLRIQDCNLTGDLPYSIGSLSNLTSLTISSCNLSGRIPSSIGNLSQLTFLQLYSNNFSGELPSSIQNLNQITNLDVANNKLSGNFPIALLNLTKLSKLSLSNNQFIGPFPPNIGSSLSNLNFFDASQNFFVGTIPYTLFTIPCLEYFILSDNQLNGPLEFGNISRPSKLQDLRLNNNNSLGPIPRSISKLVSLTELDLSHLNTQGPVDFSIFSHLKSLQGLSLSHLNTTTTIDLNAILSYFKKLGSLDLSGNHISTANISSLSDPSLELSYLNLSGCGVREFPGFIRNQQHLSRLDLSNNIIEGQVPGWLWSIPELEMVDLSNNSFTGLDGFTGDFSGGQIDILDLSNNNFSGQIPRSLCSMIVLEVLDLSNNNFNGSVPQCFDIIIKKSLSVLSLGNNHLNGNLPEIFTKCTSLRSLNVGHNNLVGKLPRSLASCSSLEVLNLEHNGIKDTFPFWLESLQKLQVLVLHSNEFHGSLQYQQNISSWFPQLRIVDISHNVFIGTLPSDFFMYWSAMSSNKDRSKLKYIGDNTYFQDSFVLMNKGVETKYTRILTLLTAIDFSGNRLTGKIPESIGLLKNLIVLNLSSNGFTGNITPSLSNLTELESLDLSHNKLSGQIPPALGTLTCLSKITVSYNNLVGPIPQSTQILTQDDSSFEGNLGLCGLPLSEKCGNVDTESESESEETEEDEEEGVLSWTAVAIGLTPGVILGLSIGYIFITQKPQWLMKISVVIQPKRRGTR